jgi:hypothetical protein
MATDDVGQASACGGLQSACRRFRIARERRAEARRRLKSAPQDNQETDTPCKPHSRLIPIPRSVALLPVPDQDVRVSAPQTESPRHVGSCEANFARLLWTDFGSCREEERRSQRLGGSPARNGSRPAGPGTVRKVSAYPIGASGRASMASQIGERRDVSGSRSSFRPRARSPLFRRWKSREARSHPWARPRES